MEHVSICSNILHLNSSISLVDLISFYFHLGDINKVDKYRFFWNSGRHTYFQWSVYSLSTDLGQWLHMAVQQLNQEWDSHQKFEGCVWYCGWDTKSHSRGPGFKFQMWSSIYLAIAQPRRQQVIAQSLASLTLTKEIPITFQSPVIDWVQSQLVFREWNDRWKLSLSNKQKHLNRVLNAIYIRLYCHHILSHI